MKVEYDKEAQALYIRVSDGVIDYTEEINDDILFDRTVEGKLVGIDILNVEFGIALQGDIVGEIFKEIEKIAIIKDKDGWQALKAKYQGGK